MADQLGIYFGPSLITMVQSRGRKIVNSINIARSSLVDTQLEEKVPEEIKLVAVFNDELRKNNIEAKDTVISLSGRDLIVRTFELPIMPPNELYNAVNFEAKKYIPFKIEDIVSDFQIVSDKAAHKNIVLFMGIKKEALDKYLSILGQLNLKAHYIDYAAFGTLRLLKLTGQGNKGIVGVVSVDLQEEDEANFVVLEKGFPVFSRDITLGSGPEGLIRPEEKEPTAVLEKLKAEIRVSLDYYNRKFPQKNIRQILFITDINNFSDLEFFIQDLGLSAKFIDTAKQIGKTLTFSLSFIKSYSSSLYKIVKTNLRLNLLAPKVIKVKAVKEISAAAEEVSLFANLRLDRRILALSLFILALTYSWGLSRILPKKRELGNILAIRPQVSSVQPQASRKELLQLESDYNNSVGILDNLLFGQQLVTAVIDAIPRNIPEDMWLTDLDFKQQEKGAELLLQGFAYLADNEKELSLVNAFLSKLKQDPVFSKYFKDIKILSVEQQARGKIKVTSFSILSKSYK
jgi:hypothetical protein